jgi:acyl carrier protein
MSPLADRITSTIKRALAVEVPASSTDLVAAGILDSLAMVSLIVAIETEFGIELPLDDFDPDRFRTVDRMAEFVAEAGGSA